MEDLFSTYKCFDHTLMNLITKGKPTEAISLLESSRDLVDNSGSTILHYAAKYDNVFAINHLIRVSFKLDVFNSQGHTPLILAVINHRRNSSEVLLEHVDVNLHNGHFRILLETILDPSCIVKSDIVQMIFGKIRTVNANNIVIANTLVELKCPLYYAAFLKNVEVMKILIDSNLPVNVKNPDNGNTALHVAVSLRNLELVQLLLDHGADVNIANHWNNLPVNRQRLYISHEDLNILRILIKKGSSLTLWNNHGYMQSQRILAAGVEDEVRTLLEAAGENIDFSVKDVEGDTMLHYLARNPQSGLFSSYLHDKDFNPNVQNTLGYTPLHYLLEKHDFHGMRVLLDKGADVNVTSHAPTSEPPVHFALQGSDVQKLKCIRDLIWDRGANIQYVTGDGEIVLSSFMNQPKSKVAPIVLRYLALLEAQGTVIIEQIRQIIDSVAWIKKDFKLYKSELDRYKTVEIIESVSVFKLLTVSDERLFGYFRNTELVLKVKSLDYKMCGSNKIFNKLLQTRARKALEIVEWREKVASVFGKIAKQTVAYGNIIANEVVYYLDLKDLQNLFYATCFD